MKWLTARPGAPKLSITIENPKPIYTTWDRVEGTVTVTTHDETDFNNIKITFEEDISSTQWVRHEPTDRTKEDKSERHLYYMTSLIAPIHIQRSAHLIQSFSTCLLSRAYFLDVRITCSLPGTAGARQTLKATLPVEVAEPHGPYDSKPPMPFWDTLDELYSLNWDPDPPPYYGHEFSEHVSSLTKGHGNALTQYQVTS
ncbi:hypothetical protein CBS147352_829 [Aspergillus niger]|nr:hypothetical protein CBS147371_3657 [Aspergillus niger]KAI2979252.1 hypothetical protein CBS147324_803 [Aspergillus niger]KAI3031264.1 hypothetical protein CBS147345_1666 [Aspergillus niger]KAI3059575.1 hypothetical protein CBS147352_829 [Aspergillus niger]